jgi:transposase
LLESAGIKLAEVVSDVFGVSGRAMLHALIDADQSPAEMAKLARGRMRRKLTELEHALRGIIPLRRLLAIPSVDRVVSATVIAETGVDMSCFRGASHLASWTAICPGNRESASRQRGGKTRKGNVFLKVAPVTAAVAAAKARGSYYADKYRRLCARRGKLKAAVAVGHTILAAIYHMLSDGTFHEDPGADYLDRLDKRRASNQLIRRLNNLGFDVQPTPKAAWACRTSPRPTASGSIFMVA